MKRRCDFLDNLSEFNYNMGQGLQFGEKKKTDTQQLGSTLISTMLHEVSDFCDPNMRENWSMKTHQQV